MIVLDSDIIVLDLRYPADVRYPVNRKVLDSLQAGNERLAITGQTLLETIGVLSFNSPAAWTADLPAKIPAWFAVEVFPDPIAYPVHANCMVSALVNIMAQRCSLDDAVVLEQIRRFIPQAATFLSWNARHFRNKLAIPVLTPEEWWQQKQQTP